MPSILRRLSNNCGCGRLEARLDRARRSLLDGYVPEEMARREIRDLEARISALTAPNDRLLEQSRAELMSIPSLWPEMTAQERTEVVQATLKDVAVDLESGAITGSAVRRGRGIAGHPQSRWAPEQGRLR